MASTDSLFVNTSDMLVTVHEQLLRAANTATATKVMDYERVRRVQANRLTEVLTAMISAINRTRSAKMEHEEQVSRVATATLQKQVLPQLESAISRRKVAKAVEIERTSRLADSLLTDPASTTQRNLICEEIRRIIAIRNAVNAAEGEREARIHDARRACLLEDVVRVVAAARASGDAMIGQQERITHSHLHDVCDDVRRSVAQRNAVQATECERDERIAADHRRNVCAELRRMMNTRIVEVAVEAEKKRRMDFILGAMQEELVRHCAQSNAIKATEAERTARIQHDKKIIVCEELERKAAQKHVREETSNAQKIAITEIHMRAVHESVIRAHNRKSATEKMEVERCSRMVNAHTLDWILAAPRRQLMTEISACSAC